jgi:hypothetical protein
MPSIRIYGVVRPNLNNNNPPLQQFCFVSERGKKKSAEVKQAKASLGIKQAT